MFQNRKLIIATKHEKEKVIAPIFEKKLGVYCFVDHSFDSDAFGTFSGEIQRAPHVIDVLRKKCVTAMEKNKCDLGIASEGSFGPHPTLFFVPADDEFVIFIDQKNNLEIIARVTSTATNFNAAEVQEEKDLIAFANQVKFPSHALILKKSKDDFSEIFKGILNENELKLIFHKFKKNSKSVYVETDMRAFCNPTRMNVIEMATQKLIQKIQSVCPQCQVPGFDVIDFKPGLQCSQCGWPTKSVLCHIYICQKCSFKKEVLYPQGKNKENPMYCDFCNP
jgi:hypothetical protein